MNDPMTLAEFHAAAFRTLAPFASGFDAAEDAICRAEQAAEQAAERAWLEAGPIDLLEDE